MLRLYHAPLSPFCRKIRLTLAEKRIEVELVDEKYWERSTDFLRRNPAGQVPICGMKAAISLKAVRFANFLRIYTPIQRCCPKPLWTNTKCAV